MERYDILKDSWNIIANAFHPDAQSRCVTAQTDPTVRKALSRLHEAGLKGFLSDWWLGIPSSTRF